MNSVEVIMNRNQEYVPDVPARAILALFKEPALEFSRRLRASMDDDPLYVESHKRELYVELDRYLRPAGITLDESKIDEQLPHVVREVVCRLRSYEVNHEKRK